MNKEMSPFYMNQAPHHSSQFIFDDAYKNAMTKLKFERNPKFSYFNAIVKMKNRLQNRHHDIYSKVFDPENRDHSENTREKSFRESANKTWMNKTFQEGQSKIVINNIKRNETSNIHEISFEPVHSRKNSDLVPRKPRLDQIMAEFRRTNRNGIQRRKNFRSTSVNTRESKISILQTRTERQLPKNYSFAIRKLQKKP